MKPTFALITSLSLVAWMAGCGKSSNDDHMHDPDATETHEPASDMHADDGATHDDHGMDMGAGHDHADDEVSLGTATIGGMEVELAQGHGSIVAGQEGHLVVKLPYTDNGQTIVRAWIGTDDRTLSMVGKGEYAPSHDDYDIHAMAPDPLPANALWWIEIEKPDGTKVVGSARPIVE